MRWIVGVLLGLLMLAGCGTDPVATGPASPTTSTSPASPGTTLGIRITLANGKSDPSGARIPAAKGTTLVFTITADHDDEVHVHGYDLEIPVTAGGTVTKEFVLDQVGRFEVESHEPQLTILELIVT